MPKARDKIKQPNRSDSFFAVLLNSVTNKLKIATRWVIDNRLSIVFFLTLTSAGLIKRNTVEKQENDFLNSHLEPWDPRMFSESAKNSIVPLLRNLSSCPTIIFYEDHADQAPANMILKLLPNLVESEYRTFIFEEPENMPINTSIERLLSIERLFSIENAMKNVRNTIAREKGGDPSRIDGTSLEPLKVLERLAEASKVSAELMSRIRKAKLNYVAMDLNEVQRKKVGTRYGEHSKEALAIRDQHMKKRIMAACKKYKTGQVVLVGAMHNSIEHALRDSGYPNVSSVYIINHPVTPANQEEGERRGHDQMLRSKDLLYMKKYRYEQVNIINIYDHSNINATKEVLLGLGERNALAY